MPKNSQTLIDEAAHLLSKENIGSAPLEATLLLEHVTNLRREKFISENPEVNDPQIESYQALVARRAAHEPLAYILGEREFYSRKFFVNSSVLIPRPETELLVEWVLKKVLPQKNFKVLDIGCGSGIIPITLKLENPFIEPTAIDISHLALEVAKKNTAHYHLENHIHFMHADILRYPMLFQDETFDGIVSNPPYIESHQLNKNSPDSLALDVLGFEPHVALDGGEDGLQFYRVLLPLIFRWLKSGGLFILECGETQARSIAAWALEQKFSNIEIIKDYSGHERFVAGYK